jgi:hypothetical protein
VSSADNQVTLCRKEVPRINEWALTSVLADVTFIESEVKRLGKEELDHVFDEVKLVSERRREPCRANDSQTINIILSDAVSAYLEPSIRNGSYAVVKPGRLAMILLKLSKGAAALPGPAAMGKAERRRREADEVSRLGQR